MLIYRRKNSNVWLLCFGALVLDRSNSLETLIKAYPSVPVAPAGIDKISA